jgi:hypothetical protein
MTIDGFEARFRVDLRSEAAWDRLVEHRPDLASGDSLWLAGFDSRVHVVAAEPTRSLSATKAEEPCAGTDIIVTMEDDETGTIVHVVQSGFGDWFSGAREMMAIGWRFIVADLQTFLATGVHPGRHLRPWGDFGAPLTAQDGAVRVGPPEPSGLAGRLGMRDGDLVVGFAGAPIASLDDLVTAQRALIGRTDEVSAAWIRGGALMRSSDAGG